MAKYIKPTLQTKFHIDFSWWQDDSRKFHRTLLDQLCKEGRSLIENENEIKTMDWIDPVTAQVFTVDQLWHITRMQCSHKPDFLTDQLPLITGAFRIFIANNNTPLTPVEMHQLMPKRPANTILRTISSKGKVYQGIRPVVPVVS